jgi:hypothetical protein
MAHLDWSSIWMTFSRRLSGRDIVIRSDQEDNVNALSKIALSSLGLIAVSLGPVPALPKSQPDRPYSVAQMPGTSCSQNGAISCIYGTRVMCLCSRYPNCSWTTTRQRC